MHSFIKIKSLKNQGTVVVMQIGFIVLSKNCRLHIIIDWERCNIATLDLTSSQIKLFSLVLRDCNIAALFLGSFSLGWLPVHPDSLSVTCGNSVITTSSKWNHICHMSKEVQSWQCKGPRKTRNWAH